MKEMKTFEEHIMKRLKKKVLTRARTLQNPTFAA